MGMYVPHSELETEAGGGKMSRVLKAGLALLLFVGLLVPAQETLARGRKSSAGYHRYRGAKAVDGDTFRYGQKRYRVQTYNAPEIGQPGSRRATRSLQRQLDSGQHGWKPVAKDTYGRTIVKPRTTRR